METHYWAEKPLGETTRVTLLGDAIHAMTPHAGLGANTAFKDAIDLRKALGAEDWRAALKEYEETLVKRGNNGIKRQKDIYPFLRRFWMYENYLIR